MPMYEFVCNQCGHEFEELVRTSRDQHAAKCPECGGQKPTRKLSVFSARTAAAPAMPAGGACGRCGDPNGPCGA